jgi:kinesin family member C2/C3
LHTIKFIKFRNKLFFCPIQSGPDVTAEETWGVNYRSLNDLFEISQTRADSITYDVKVQMIEIYNEQVRDLLMTDGANKRYPFSC